MGRKSLAVLRAQMVVGLGMLLLGACAPSVKAVPNMSTGATGCPVGKMVAFNYHRGNRTWNAACGDQQFVCSARGGVRCAKQQADTLDTEVAIRAKALTELPERRREWFVNKDLTKGSWHEFAMLVATVQAMTDEQLEDLDPRRIFTGWTKALEQPMKDCVGTGKLSIYVEQSGALTTFGGGCSAVVDSPELKPLKPHHGKTFFLLPGVYDVKPIARPSLDGEPASESPTAAKEADSAPDPASTTAPPEGSKELEAAVRRWLDSERGAILGCTGKEQSALQVKVEPDHKVEVSLRGAAPGSPEQGCVQSALAKVPELPAGSATILHLVRN